MIWFVLGVSVAAKWVLRGPEEKLIPEARELLLRLVKGEIQIIVPDFFWVELGNVLWKAVCARSCTRAVPESGMREARQQGVITISSHGLIEAALDIAIRFDRTVYDSVYVALAHRRSAHLITADERLANALAAHFPARWLGSL